MGVCENTKRNIFLEINGTLRTYHIAYGLYSCMSTPLAMPCSDLMPRFLPSILIPGWSTWPMSGLGFLNLWVPLGCVSLSRVCLSIHPRTLKFGCWGTQASSYWFAVPNTWSRLAGLIQISSIRLVPSPPSRSHVFKSMSLHVDDHVLLAAKARRRTAW